MGIRTFELSTKWSGRAICTSNFSKLAVQFVIVTRSDVHRRSASISSFFGLWCEIGVKWWVKTDIIGVGTILHIRQTRPFGPALSRRTTLFDLWLSIYPSKCKQTESLFKKCRSCISTFGSDPYFFELCRYCDRFAKLNLSQLRLCVTFAVKNRLFTSIISNFVVIAYK